MRNIYDINRDGRVNATDTGLIRSNQQTSGIVAPLTVPLPPSVPLGAGTGDGVAAPSISMTSGIKRKASAPNHAVGLPVTVVAPPPRATLVEPPSRAKVGLDPNVVFSPSPRPPEELRSKLESLDLYLAKY